MMTFFIFCAAVGGTILLLQLILMLVGLGGDHDVGVHDGHMDFGDHGIDAGHQGFGDHPMEGDHADQGSSAFFGVLSFRALVAAVTFFGLGGMTAVAAEAPQYVSVVLAGASGAAAMFIVAWLMRLLHSLGEEGNVKIERTVGSAATVYLSIPPKGKGTGKITVRLQDRTMEYQAITQETEELPTGAQVVVVAVVTPDTVEVEALRE